jgi:hypothetical protein
MGAQLWYGTAGATGGGFSAQPGTLQPAFAESWNEPRWSWQQRSPKTWKDRDQWRSLWSFGCRLQGGNGSGQDGSAAIGMDLQAPGLYEPYSCDGEGTQSMNFLRGLCVDSGGTPVANAIVQGFVTSTDTFAGEVQANNDGTYLLGVQQSKATAHYLVAYKTGAPDTMGTTVNTLLPTNVDGT